MSILLYKLKPSSQYNADLGVMSGVSVSGVNELAEEHSQFSVPNVCIACIPTLNYLTFDLDPRGKNICCNLIGRMLAWERRNRTRVYFECRDAQSERQERSSVNVFTNERSLRSVHYTRASVVLGTRLK